MIISSILTLFLVEFATVGKTKDGRIYHHLWGADEITTLLKEHDLAKDENADGDRIIS
jgi:20S proteasome subunit alpha 3